MSSMYLYTRMAMPIAIRAKKTLDMNMMQRQETPPRMDKDLLEKFYFNTYCKFGLTHQ